MERRNIFIKSLVILLIIIFSLAGICRYKFPTENWTYRVIRDKKTSRISWTKEVFQKKLKQVSERIESTSAMNFNNDEEGVKVYSAFTRHKEEWGYNDWRDALETTGLEISKKTKWKKGLFKEKLKEVADRLGSTSSSKFENDEMGSKVYSAFTRHKEEWEYGSWKKAVKSAGLTPIESTDWTKELFKKKLKQVAGRLKSTSTADFSNDKEGTEVYSAFKVHRDEWGYENWFEAVKSVGLEPVKSNKEITWTKRLFEKKLEEVVKELGTTSAGVISSNDKGVKVYFAFYRHKDEWGYDSWKSALKSIGVEANERIKWTKEKFIEELKETEKDLGTASSRQFLNHEKGRKVYGAFTRHKEKWGYDSWKEAVKSAGFEPIYKTNWTKELFKKKLKQVADRLGTTSMSEFQKDEEGKKICGAFGKHKTKWGYESWRKAVKSVELEPIKTTNWTKEVFKKRVKEVAKRLESSSTRDFQNDKEGIKVYGAFDNHKEEWGYSSWREAVKSVGLEPASKMEDKSSELSEEQFMERLKKEFLRKLKEVAEDLENPSLENFLQDKKGIKVYLEFKNHKEKWGYESWAEMIKSVEIDSVERENKSKRINWDKETFKSKLKEVSERLDSISSKDFQNDEEGVKIYAAFNRHKEEWGYDSWSDALESAGIK